MSIFSEIPKSELVDLIPTSSATLSPVRIVFEDRKGVSSREGQVAPPYMLSGCRDKYQLLTQLQSKCQDVVLKVHLASIQWPNFVWL